MLHFGTELEANQVLIASHIYRAFILCSAHEKSNADFAPHMKRNIVSWTILIKYLN